MQKQKKQFIAILILAVICVAVYLAAMLYNKQVEEKKTAQEESEKIYVTGLNEGDVTAFTYQVNGVTQSFVYKDDTWYNAEDESMKLTQASVKSMAESIEQMTAEDVITDAEDVSDYGFDTPTNILTYTTAEGTYTLTIGMSNSITGSYYLMSSDASDVYVISSTDATAFSSDMESLIDT